MLFYATLDTSFKSLPDVIKEISFIIIDYEIDINRAVPESPLIPRQRFD